VFNGVAELNEERAMDASDRTQATTRRALLTGAVGATAAVVMSGIRPATTSAADSDPVLLSEVNEATGTTVIRTSGDEQTGLNARSLSAVSGVGVIGFADGTDAAGGLFATTAATGLTYGVHARSQSPGGVGVLARNTTGAVGLAVDGKAAFRRSGKASVAAGTASITVTLSGVASSSMVFAMLAESRADRWVRAVVPTSGSFKIYLNRNVTKRTRVSWFVLDPFPASIP
jgi:hypothetical protein